MWKLRKASILSLCMLTVLLSACSYKEFEDSMRSKINNKEEEQYSNPSSVPDNSSESDEEALLSIGDTTTYLYPEGQSVQYTLNQVHVLDNINDLNLNIEDFADKNLISDDGAIENTYRFVAVEVTVKNIDFEGHSLEENDPTLYIESLVGFKEGIEHPDGPFVLYASYFSEHPPLDQNRGQDYYQFALPVSKEMNATIGWFLPTDQLGEEKLYYIIGGEGSPDYFRYFELNFD